ncbi:hypothetical protein NE237_015249 [Protea cynaroides]|uniref:Uncharacterized protein n=1 Tax=Protea cynaroides TaxID=273540 RepID=A0A9Q0QQW4_9MAGN|nr:hypothetical protein NE237_015249 [Protea cynaroides]
MAASKGSSVKSSGSAPIKKRHATPSSLAKATAKAKPKPRVNCMFLVRCFWVPFAKRTSYVLPLLLGFLNRVNIPALLRETEALDLLEDGASVATHEVKDDAILRQHGLLVDFHLENANLDDLLATGLAPLKTPRTPFIAAAGASTVVPTSNSHKNKGKSTVESAVKNIPTTPKGSITIHTEPTSKSQDAVG